MFLYQNKIKDILTQIKFESHREVAHILSNKLSDIMLDISTLDIDIIQAVPLHPIKEKQRGFNQVDVIFSCLFKPEAINLINRTKKTEPLFDLTREERQNELKNAFSITEPAYISGKNILLFDDILTTGATLSEIGALLKKAGAKHVYAITIAYAPLIATPSNANV